MDTSSTPTRRLQAVANHTSGDTAQSNGTPLLILPDGGKVTVTQAPRKEGPHDIFHNGIHILSYTISENHKLAFDIVAIGTRFQGTTTHIPKYKLLIINAPPSPAFPTRPKDLTLVDCWVSVYALFTLYHTQENIPVAFGSFSNTGEIKQYLFTSGLARAYPIPEVAAKLDAPSAEDFLFLSRAMFWQGAGTTGFHDLPSWILGPRPVFPPVASYTRSERVIATHPLRPAKPQPGELLYRRWCSAVGQMLDITYFDLDGVHDGSKGRGEDGVSRHLAAFHSWHNDDRVNNAWGERASIEGHRQYIEGLLADPHAIPCMLSWDGELMGYVEIVYTKEDHVAQNYPTGVVPGEWERGIHVLTGESKFLGKGRSEIWIRSLCHYIFLADPRTDRVVGEPSQDNQPIARVARESGFHVQTIFDFPYKRSLMVLNPREKFFTLCKLC